MDNGDRWIAAQNVERFKKQLTQETDPAKREMLLEMIEQERQRLKRG